MNQNDNNGENMFPGERLLTVDDEASIRKLLRRRLSSEGYLCEEAGSAEEALDVLTARPVSLVILDIKLPGKSGVELLPEIKTGYPETAVVMATCVSEMSVAVQCLKQGADDYICKPFNLDEVSLSIQRALERRGLELQVKEYQNSLEQKVQAQTLEIRKLSLGAIESLVFALEAKDRYSGGHSRRVARMALAVGDELGLSPDHMEDLRWGSLLHDVGKIAVDQRIQGKPERLTDEEYEHIMIHAHVGAGIVQPVANERVVKMIEHHHDYYDGSGLLQALAGSDIPLEARVLAVADAFDAMTSDRPYRRAMSAGEALAEIERCAGSQFDPIVVTAFVKAAGDGALTMACRRLEDGTGETCEEERGSPDGGTPDD